MSGFDIRLQGLKKDEIADAIENAPEEKGYRSKIVAANKTEEAAEVEAMFQVAKQTVEAFAAASSDDGYFDVHVSAQGRVVPATKEALTGEPDPILGRDSLYVYIASASDPAIADGSTE